MNLTGFFRKSAGLTFIAGNLNLLAFGGDLTVSGALLLATSASLFASAKNPKWLYAAGGSMITAWGIIGLNSNGDGAFLQTIAPAFAFAQGALLMRAGYNLTTDNAPISFNGILGKVFNKIDKYTLASAGAIELPGTLLATGAAVLSDNIPLMISAGLWSIANGLLIASDPALRKNNDVKPQ